MFSRFELSEQKRVTSFVRVGFDEFTVDNYFSFCQHVHEPGMPYDFNYAVKDDSFGNDYSHQASSDGDIVRGEYKIQLPDGRTQVVKYTASWKDGFSAQVTTIVFIPQAHNEFYKYIQFKNVSAQQISRELAIEMRE